MTWTYQIVKNKDGYWLAEVFGGHSWYLVQDTCSDTAEELQKDLEMRYKDSIKNEILLIKGNKLVKQNAKPKTKKVGKDTKGKRLGSQI